MKRFNKHIIVVGSARSGTSWLCELLARPRRYRLLFEPEHEFQTPQGHLLCDRWTTSEEEAGEAKQYLKKVFANKIDNDWIAQHSNRKWKRHLWPFIPKRFVIKFVRCNLAARYMNEVFDIPVIHIIRDPFEVLDSQRRVKFPWLYTLDRFQQQEPLVAYVATRYQFDLMNLTKLSSLERLTLRWCLENALSLAEHEEGRPHYKVVRYDELRNDMELFKKLCMDFGFEWVVPLELYYDKPSSKAHPKGNVTKEVAYGNFSPDEQLAIMKLLKQFELEQFAKLERR